MYVLTYDLSKNCVIMHAQNSYPNYNLNLHSLVHLVGKHQIERKVVGKSLF